jgi:hypothetical protein
MHAFSWHLFRDRNQNEAALTLAFPFPELPIFVVACRNGRAEAHRGEGIFRAALEEVPERFGKWTRS